jgi:hypothetical protein
LYTHGNSVVLYFFSGFKSSFGAFLLRRKAPKEDLNHSGPAGIVFIKFDHQLDFANNLQNIRPYANSISTWVSSDEDKMIPGWIAILF